MKLLALRDQLAVQAVAGQPRRRADIDLPPQSCEPLRWEDHFTCSTRRTHAGKRESAHSSKNNLVAGTRFSETAGRTDLPGGTSIISLFRSKTLLKLAIRRRHPRHGPQTTIVRSGSSTIFCRGLVGFGALLGRLGWTLRAGFL